MATADSPHHGQLSRMERNDQVDYIRGLAFKRAEHTRRDKATVTHRDVLVLFSYDISNDTAYKRMKQAARRYDELEYIDDDHRDTRLLLRLDEMDQR